MFKYLDASARNPNRPHHFVSTDSQMLETTCWCIEQFGEPAYYQKDVGALAISVRDQLPTKVGRWVHHGHTKYWLRDEADAFAFRMRWC